MAGDPHPTASGDADQQASQDDNLTLTGAALEARLRRDAG